MKKNKLLLVILALLTISMIGGVIWWNNQLQPVSNDAKLQVVVIPEGEGILAIGERLQSQGLIKSALAFRIYAGQNNLSGKIQAGSFKVSPSQTLPQIAEALTKGTDDVWVTIIEGRRVEEIANQLNQELGISSVEFLSLAKEGYMFPDTYLFPKDATAQYIITALERNFNSKYSVELQSKIKALGLTPEEGVILASLVEREGRSDKVRTEVAGIMLKRLSIGMKLDIDATVQYAKDSAALQSGNLTKFWQPITRADYSGISSDFNTYLVNGLPPAPICNPSLASLNAVANANPNTPYLYYYHDSQGNSHYARTLDEHNQNVANNR